MESNASRVRHPFMFHYAFSERSPLCCLMLCFAAEICGVLRESAGISGHLRAFGLEQFDFCGRSPYPYTVRYSQLQMGPNSGGVARDPVGADRNTWVSLTSFLEKATHSGPEQLGLIGLPFPALPALWRHTCVRSRTSHGGRSRMVLPRSIWPSGL